MNTFSNISSAKFSPEFSLRFTKEKKFVTHFVALFSLLLFMLAVPTMVQAQAVSNIDLRKWKVESYPSGTASNWVIRDNGNTVEQTVNAGPTFYYSDFPVSGADIGGTIRVNTKIDDDFIGFALGFNPGDTSNSNANYLLIDWKRVSQAINTSGASPDCSHRVTGTRGLVLSRVVGIPTGGEFWGRTNLNNSCTDINNGLNHIARGKTLGNSGWSRYTNYRFRFDFSETALKVWVNDVLQFDVTGEFSQGHIAFYNYSQNNVRYGGYTVNNVFANAGRDQSVLAGNVAMLDGTASGPGDVQYQWTQISGLPVTLTGENTARPTFTAPQIVGKANLAFQLVTSLGAESSDPDIVNIEVVDSALPVYLSRSVGYDASNNTVTGFAELNEPGRIGVRVSDPDTNGLLAETVSNTATSAPFSSDFALPLPPESTPPIIRVGLQAQDSVGNELPELALLMATDRTASNSSDPVSGALLRLDGVLVDLVASNNGGNPVVEFIADQQIIAGDGAINFTLNEQQARALCGLGNQCVVYVDGEAISTIVSVLPGGDVQFTAPLQEAAGNLAVGTTVRVELRIDRNVGSSGASSAVDPATGNQFGATGGTAEIVQTILFNDGSAQLTAGSQGGDTTVSFTLSPEQDHIKCAGIEGVCVVQENNSLDIPTQRTVLGNGNVQYSAVVTMAANETKLYTLRVQDILPPQVGNISLSVPIVQGGQSVDFSVNVQDNTRIVTVVCRYILPDGTVVEVVASETSPGSGVWEWSYAPPGNGGVSGEIIVEVIVTDLAGNTTIVQPINAETGEPAKLIVDNDLPTISLPANPVVAPGVVNGVPVAAPGQCVTLNIVASDATSDIANLNFIIVKPDGSELVVSASENIELGVFSAEVCIDADDIGGQYNIIIEATDSVGNVIVVECDSFVVNTAPVVDAGNDIWVKADALAQFNGSFTDPDPLDAHTIDWLTGDGNSLFGTLTPEYSYSAAGIYIATLTVTDAVGELGSDTAQVFVTGNGELGEMCRKNFWKKQFIEKKPRKGKQKDKDDKEDEKEDAAEDKELFGDNSNEQTRRKCKARIKGENVINSADLVTYMALIREASSYFDEQQALTTLEDGAAILTAKGGPVRNRAIRQTLAAWFNFARGAVSFDDMVNINKDPAPDMTFAEAMAQIEAVLNNPNAKQKELKAVRKMALRINRS